MIDRRKWEELVGAEQRRAQREQQIAVALTRLRQAAVPMERLTGSEVWDTFLRHGEALQEADRIELASLQEQLILPRWLAPEALQELHFRASALQIALVARQELLDLPKAILESVHKAAEVSSSH